MDIQAPVRHISAAMGHHRLFLTRLAPLWVLFTIAPGVAAADDMFPKPKGLEDRVAFWIHVFSEVPSSALLVHDRENLGIIWGKEPLPEGKREGRALIKYGKKISETYKAALEDIRDTGGAATSLNKRLKQVLSEHQDISLNQAIRNLRTQRGASDRFEAGIERYNKYGAKVRGILREENVPEELVALAFVETMFNPKSYSHAGAAGLWQLMPATARQLRLRVRRGRDERMNVPKATRAAARMLRKNKEMLKHWPLAITAYNHGPNGMRRAVKSMKTTDLPLLIRTYRKSTWGFASKNFYAEFLAAHEVLQKRTAEPSEPTPQP